MSAPHVAVVGGGLAGIRTALRCADAGLRVSLFEARPALGGATWSTEKRGLQVDNGQHVFMRCCTAYRGLLERLGVSDRVFLQERLAVPVAAPGRAMTWLRRHPLPAPAHLAPSLLRFAYLPLRARVRAALTAQQFAKLDPDDPRIDRESVGGWLTRHGAGDPDSLALWDLLIRPTLNLPVADASLSLAAKVLRTGFLDRSDAADIGFARVPFADLHARPAEAALRAAGGAVHCRAAAEHVATLAEGCTVRAAGETFTADAVVLATPPETAARLAPEAAGLDADGLGRLGRSPIVNLHVWFDRRVMREPFVAGWHSPLQWTFDRTEAAGVDRGQVVTVSLSGAEEWIGRAQAELRAVFLPAFHALFPASREAEVLDFFVVAEPSATFRQVPGTRLLRPANATKCRAVFVAGNWTDTGWPATMEGAVLSGQAAADGVIAELRSPGRSAA